MNKFETIETIIKELYNIYNIATKQRQSTEFNNFFEEYKTVTRNENDLSEKSEKEIELQLFKNLYYISGYMSNSEEIKLMIYEYQQDRGYNILEELQSKIKTIKQGKDVKIINPFIIVDWGTEFFGVFEYNNNRWEQVTNTLKANDAIQEEIKRKTERGLTLIDILEDDRMLEFSATRHVFTVIK